MNVVRPKKNLGQHFLTDQNIAKKIVDSLGNKAQNVLEVGPGMGVLTNFLIQRTDLNTFVIEIDKESVEYLKNHFAALKDKIYFDNFLKFDFEKVFHSPFSVIGNFPYNISSQIFFKILENRNQIPEVVGMIQKEVAERIASKHGNKTYGILSVLLQAYYDIDYLFTVNENVFSPPPKVKSAVIRLERNSSKNLDCDEKLFVTVVKTAFNYRRKMLRKSLKSITNIIPEKYAEKRPEQLSVNDFIELTRAINNLEKS